VVAHGCRLPHSSIEAFAPQPSGPRAVRLSPAAGFGGSNNRQRWLEPLPGTRVLLADEPCPILMI
jgi:hypothetical protein